MTAGPLKGRGSEGREGRGARVLTNPRNRKKIKRAKWTQRDRKDSGWQSERGEGEGEEERGTDLGDFGMVIGGSSDMRTHLLSRGCAGFRRSALEGCRGGTMGFSSGHWGAPGSALEGSASGLLASSVSMAAGASWPGTGPSGGRATGSFSRLRFWTRPLPTSEYTQISH